MQKVDEGVDKLADLIGSTMSSQGKSVLIEVRSWGQDGRPTSLFKTTKDGVSVAKEYQDEDTTVNVAIQVLVQAGIATNEKTDDGTTSSIVLGRSVYKNGRRNMGKWTNVNAFKRGMLRAANDIEAELKLNCTQVTTPEEKLGLAMASCVDEDMARFVVDVIDQAGDSDIIYKYTNKVELRSEVEPAFTIKSGILNTTINAAKKTPIEGAHILIYPRIMANVQHLTTFVQNMIPALGLKRGSGIIIFTSEIVGGCNNLTQEVLQDTGINILAVKMPNEQSRQWPDGKFMADLAAFTGAKVTEYELDKVRPEDLAQVERVLIDKEETTIINPAGPDVSGYIQDLKDEAEATDESGRKEELEDRIRRLTGRIVGIYHRAHTNGQTGEERDRLQDAIPALKNAIKEGYVTGGGVALLNIRKTLSIPNDLTPDEALGYRSVLDALAAPIEQIIANTGLNPRRIIPKLHGNLGYNVNTSQVSDLMADGVIDPVNVVYTALRSGVGAAINLLTLSGAILINDSEGDRE